MSWHPADLVSDVDLSDYEAAILTNFGQSSWQPRRTKALEDWLFPILKANNLDPYRLRTRFEWDNVQGYTASAYADLTSASQSTTDDDLDLAAVLATPSTDALYLGSTQPFRGVFVRMLESVSAVSGALTVKYWDGTWKALSVTDGTAQTTGKPFSGGGSITWVLPVDWMTRSVNGSDPLYFVKITVSATPTGALAGQLGAIRSSALRAPAVFRTLQLIFQEAPTGLDGPWGKKAEFYRQEAEAALQRALAIVGGEFETDDPPTDLISATEAAQTTAEASGETGGFRWERG